MLMTMYGIRIKSETDKYFVVAQRAIDAASRAMVPGAFLVDIFPICKYILPRSHVISVKFPRSEARPRVVPRRWLSQNCEGWKEGLG